LLSNCSVSVTCGRFPRVGDHGNPELPADVPARVLFLSDEHTTIAIGADEAGTPR